MRTVKLLAVLSVLTLVLSGSALATSHFRALTTGADCEGWMVSGSIYIAGGASVDFYYDVTLSQDGSPVVTVNGMETVYANNDVFSIGGTWGMELCGDYEASGQLYFTSPYGDDLETFSITFTCECNGDEYCGDTPGFWKNHPDAWPVSSLMVGGVPYSMAQLMVILNKPTRGDVTIILTQHLIAAKLNLIGGSIGGLQEAIDAADAYLVANPLYSRPVSSTKTEGVDIKNDLVPYNEMGCIGTPVAVFGTLKLNRTPLGGAEETKSWGAIKKARQ